MIVCKFGGTSVAGDESSQSIKEIVSGNKNRKFIVVSALGKNYDFLVKVTDRLFEIYHRYSLNLDNSKLVDEVFERYSLMSKRLGVEIDWDILKKRLLDEMEVGVTKEYLISRGEYYSAMLYAKYLNAQFLDAKDYIIFKKNGQINYISTKSKLQALDKDKMYVMGGFYGADNKGKIVLFERGGADITGAVVAKCFNAEIYENYTDVDGVYDKNPNVFNGAKNLPIISFKSALKMAENGNEIVHSRALKELRDTNIILLVKSTMDYKKLGTVVTNVEKFGNDVYVCSDKNILIRLNKFNDDKKEFLLDGADITNVFWLSDEYFVLLKNDIRGKEAYANEGMIATDVMVTRIFTNFRLNDLAYKKLKKIKKKLKKYSIFCEFTEYYNNLTIISSIENYKIIVDIINNQK